MTEELPTVEMTMDESELIHSFDDPSHNEQERPLVLSGYPAVLEAFLPQEKIRTQHPAVSLLKQCPGGRRGDNTVFCRDDRRIGKRKVLGDAEPHVPVLEA
jgi:hypothetical protein